MAALSNRPDFVFQSFILPAMISLLPWRWGFRLLKGILGRYPSLYAEGMEEEVLWASAAGLVDDETEWLLRRRLIEAVDRVDWFMAWTRNRRRWLNKHVQVSGQWPQGEQFAAFGLHWGGGAWVMASIAESTGPVSMMLRPVADDAPTLARRLGHFAFRSVARLSGKPITFTGKGLRSRLAQLREDRVNLVVLLDIPPEPQQQCRPVTVHDYPFRFTYSMVEHALNQEVPTVLFNMGLDMDTGQRKLRITPMTETRSVHRVLQQTGRQLGELWTEQSAYWRLWRFLPLFSPEMAAYLMERHASAGD